MSVGRSRRDWLERSQYSGDGDSAFRKLPNVVNGLGKVDLRLCVDGDRTPTMESCARGWI